MVAMVVKTMERQVLQLFGELLEYPQIRLPVVTRECEAAVVHVNPEAASFLRKFRSFAEGAAPGELEEIYIGTFELDAASCPYVGYHLLGESYGRSVFMLELKQRYKACGFDAGAELPDHLSVVLRFLAACDDAAVAQEIVQDAVLPVLRKMLGEDDDDGSLSETDDTDARQAGREVYGHLLRALRSVLEGPWGDIT